MFRLLLRQGYALVVLFLFAFMPASAQTVTQIKATYKGGQVFITWKNLSGTNKRYKIYRSSEKIGNSTKLNSSIFMGYVTDNSGKNIRKSQLKGTDHYYKIDATDSPLDANSGLFVLTCADNKKWFYAVTTEDIATGVETKTISLGANSMSVSTQEHKESPQPVLQQTLDLGGGTTSYEYVIWGNKQSTSTMGAFNNVGSIGYNFTFIQHSQTEDGLYVLYRDDDPFSDATPDNCEDCSVLLIDDWLPNGFRTYWFGYNENYDIYSSSNGIPTTGTIRAYTQTRIRYILNWVTETLPVNPAKVYASGFSHNGFGALLTANLIPDMIAAEWLNVAPPIIKAVNGSDYEKLWCDNAVNLETDVLNPVTGAAMNIWEVFDMRTMFELNTSRGLPFIGAIHGKQDNQVGWVQQLNWYDSLEFSRQGGVWYWDQRQHNGSGKQFLDDEIKFDLRRFASNKSYPAFSYCSINQDPGNGSKSDGDPYGAINGYLDWDDASVIDQKCDYTIECFVRDMYVNGVLQPQFDSCTADITLRRLQKFKPNIGATVSWSIEKSNGQTAAAGSLIYDGSPITLSGAKIYRSGSAITLHIENCNRIESEDAPLTQEIGILRRDNGYLIRTTLANDALVHISLFDLAGRALLKSEVNWSSGVNEFPVEIGHHGEYIIRLEAKDFAVTRKLFF
jgi:hypothetical protein